MFTVKGSIYNTQTCKLYDAKVYGFFENEPDAWNFLKELDNQKSDNRSDFYYIPDFIGSILWTNTSTLVIGMI